MVIYKNGTIISNSAFPDTDFCGDADFVVPDDSELAKKIFGIKSNAKLIFDDGRPVDAVETEPNVHDPVPTDHERLEALESLFSEIGSLSLLSGIKMSKFYELQIRLGKISIDDVPLRWREQVRKELEEN